MSTFIITVYPSSNGAKACVLTPGGGLTPAKQLSQRDLDRVIDLITELAGPEARWWVDSDGCES